MLDKTLSLVESAYSIGVKQGKVNAIDKLIAKKQAMIADIDKQLAELRANK